MSEHACIRLPFLHPTLSEFAQSSMEAPALYLSPGISHNDMACRWVADEYFFDRQTADRFLAEIKAMSVQETQLEKARLEFQGLGAEEAEELSALGQFAQNGQKPDSNVRLDHIREAAQKILLWTWHQEELLLEIMQLIMQAALAEDYLRNNFRGNPEEIKSRSRQPEIMGAPDWSVVTRGAAVFAPASMPIFAEGDMATALLENLDFEYEPELARSLGFAPDDEESILCARAPLYSLWNERRASGNSEAARFFRQVYEAERIWIVRSRQ